MESDDKKLYTPKYVQIEDHIISEIRNGRLKTGDRIPSEAELVRMFGVSRITVTTAIKELTARGILVRRDDPEISEETDGFSAAQAGSAASASRTIAFGGGIRLASPEKAEQKPHTLLENRIISADPVLCRKLGLDAGSYVYQIVRCIRDGGKTSEMDFTYIPLSVCGGHTFDCAELSTSLIHDYISRNFPEKPTGVDIYLQPELTGDIDVSMMTGEGDGPAGMPLFFWDTVVRSGKKVLAVTTTASKLYQGMKFLTFEIPALP